MWLISVVSKSGQIEIVGIFTSIEAYTIAEENLYEGYPHTLFTWHDIDIGVKCTLSRQEIIDLEKVFVHERPTYYQAFWWDVDKIGMRMETIK